MLHNVQLWPYLVVVVVVCVCVRGRGSDRLELSTHTGPCSSWQIKMNSVVFGSGSSFIIFHFAQRASQTSAAACHVKTLYQALTAPPMHTHTHTGYAWLIHTSLELTPPARSPAYVGNICSDLSHYHFTRHNSLCAA